MTNWMRPQVMVSFETPEIEDGWQDEYAEAVPQIGAGIVGPGGVRWRVVDVWHSYDKHGQVDYGVHVYLDRVARGSDGDLPGALYPEYFEV